MVNITADRLANARALRSKQKPNFAAFKYNDKKHAATTVTKAIKLIHRGKKLREDKQGFSKRIVLAGNPNSGKTTLFNALCHTHQHIGNWAGVTVESKVGRLFADKNIEVVDLPGIYSLSPLSPDEKVAGDYLKQNQADLIINIIDGTNLIRNLFLTTQLLEERKNLLLALNMQDELEKRGFIIDVKELEKIFCCKCINISAAKGDGIDKLISYILKKNYRAGKSYDFSAPTKEEQAYLRYAFIKRVAAKCLVPLKGKSNVSATVFSASQASNPLAQKCPTCWEQNTDGCRSQSAEQDFIRATPSAPPNINSAPPFKLPFPRPLSAAVSQKNAVEKKQENANRPNYRREKNQAPIAAPVHNKPCKNDCSYCGKCGSVYPYYIERNKGEQRPADNPHFKGGKKENAEQNGLPKNQSSHEDYPRQNKKSRHENGASLSDKIDAVVTNKWLAFPIFLLVISGLFFLSVEGLGGFLTRLLKDSLAPLVIEKTKTALSFLPSWLNALLCDGALNGMFSVISFLPQIMLLFGLISCLEASGYMARVVFITDRILSKVGLSGRSVIPFVTACGCAVPAIMSARTIKNVREHHAAVMLCPLMPCSAKTALFAFFTAAIFNGNTAVALSLYFLSLLAAGLAAYLLKITDRKKINSNDAFIIELPPYRAPRIKNVLKDMWDKGKSFLVKAGTIIFLASAAMSFLGSFDWRFSCCDADKSILADIGRFIAPIFKPLGFGEWQFSVATLSGLAAKETTVSTLQILYKNAPLTNFISPQGAYSFMAFNLLCAPCIAAVAACFKELGRFSLGLKALFLQTATAYICSFLIYQGAMLSKNNSALFLTVIATIVFLSVFIILAKKAFFLQKNY